MKTHTYPDGSVSHYYEDGDLVEITADDHYSTLFPYKKGHWGKVRLADREDRQRGMTNSISFVWVVIAGHSHDEDSFVQQHKVPVWDLKPYEGVVEEWKEAEF